MPHILVADDDPDTRELVEIVLRRGFDTGITAAPLIIQHLALFVGMAGGVLAAREGRLLALSTLGQGATGYFAAARLFSVSVSVAVTVFLAAASFQFVASERPFARRKGCSRIDRCER